MTISNWQQLHEHHLNVWLIWTHFREKSFLFLMLFGPEDARGGNLALLGASSLQGVKKLQKAKQDVEFQELKDKVERLEKDKEKDD